VIKRVAVLTGGGDAPGLNAVIRGIAKSAMYKYNVEVYGVLDGFKGLMEDRVKKLEPKDISGLIAKGGTILGTTNRDNPFRIPFTIGGEVEYKDLSSWAINNFHKNKFDALIVIGGDGSLSIGYEFYKLGIPIIGVPKTIDNDLMETDVTFGFNTAVETATFAIDKLHTTAESHHRVMIIEVMGRYAGWIALESGIAGGADVILIPEIPYTIENVIKKIREREEEGKRFSIIVIAEGAKEKEGELVVKKIVKTGSDPIRLGGVGNVLGEKIESMSNIETRVTVLGHLQRGGSPSPYDRVLATRFGVEAMKLAWEGQFGYMVALKGRNIEKVRLEDAIKKLKKVPDKCELVDAAKALGISFGDE